ncbi:protein FAM185A-like [Ciona intestinalis]
MPAVVRSLISQLCCRFTGHKIKPLVSVFPRLFHATDHVSDVGLTKTWRLKVEPFWKLRVNVRGCNVHVESFDPNIDPDGKEMHVHLKGSRGADAYNIEDQSETKTISISNTNEGGNLDELRIKVPVAFNIDICSKKSAVISVSSLESNCVSVEAENGDIHVKNIKGRDITLQAKKGTITCKTLLQGNLSLNGSSVIKTDRMQGPSIQLTSNSSIYTQDIYAEDVTIQARNTVGIKSIHGNSKIFSEGDINIGTLEGQSNISSAKGAINVYIANPTPIAVVSDNIQISVPSDLSANLNCNASILDIPEYISQQNTSSQTDNKFRAELNGGGPVIQAWAKYHFKFATKTWLERTMEYRKLEKTFSDDQP